MTKKFLGLLVLVLSIFAIVGCKNNPVEDKISVDVKQAIEIAHGDTEFFAEARFKDQIVFKVNGEVKEFTYTVDKKELKFDEAGTYDIVIHVKYLEKLYDKTIQVTVLPEPESPVKITAEKNTEIEFGDQLFDYKDLFTVKVNGNAQTLEDNMIDASKVKVNVPGAYDVELVYSYEGKEYKATASVIVKEKVVLLGVGKSVAFNADLVDYKELFALKVNGKDEKLQESAIDASAVKLDVPGEYTVKAVYTYKEVEYSAEAKLTVLAPVVDITVKAGQSIALFDNNFDYTKLFEIKVSGKRIVVTLDMIDSSEVDVDSIGTYQVSLAYQLLGETYTSNVNVKVDKSAEQYLEDLEDALKVDYETNIEYLLENSYYDFLGGAYDILVSIKVNGNKIALEYDTEYGLETFYFELLDEENLLGRLYFLEEGVWMYYDEYPLDLLVTNYGAIIASVNGVLNKDHFTYVDGKFLVKDEFVEEIALAVFGEDVAEMDAAIEAILVDGKIQKLSLSAAIGTPDFMIVELYIEIEYIALSDVVVNIPDATLFIGPEVVEGLRDLTEAEITQLQAAFALAYNNYTIRDLSLYGISHFIDGTITHLYFHSDEVGLYIYLFDGVYYIFNDETGKWDALDEGDYEYNVLSFNFSALDLATIKTDGTYFYITGDIVKDFAPYFSDFEKIAYFRFQLDAAGYLSIFDVCFKEEGAERYELASFELENVNETVVEDMPEFIEPGKLLYTIDFNEIGAVEQPVNTTKFSGFQFITQNTYTAQSMGETGIRLGSKKNQGVATATFDLTQAIDTILITAFSWGSDDTEFLDVEIAYNGKTVKETIYLSDLPEQYIIKLPEAITNFTLKMTPPNITGRRVMISEILLGIGDFGVDPDEEEDELRELTAEEQAIVLEAFGKDYSNVTILDDILYYGVTIYKSGDEVSFVDEYGTYYYIVKSSTGELILGMYNEETDDYDEEVITKADENYDFYAYVLYFSLIDVEDIYTDGKYYYVDLEALDFEFFPALTYDEYVEEIQLLCFTIEDGYVVEIYAQFIDSSTGELAEGSFFLESFGTTVLPKIV